jgi:CubicO group peptidase (beta-lactamase class C family)
MKLSRRQFFGMSAAFGGAAMLHGLGFQLDNTDAVVVYYDQNADYHRAQVSQLKAGGYQPLAISLYDSLYAAVFIQHPGPDWQTADGLTATQLVTLVSENAHNGYYPTLIAATGAGIFAVVLSKLSAPTTLKFDLSGNDPENVHSIAYWNLWGLKNRQMLTSAAVYGTTTRRLTAGIWTPNPTRSAWNAANDPHKLVDRRFNAQTQHDYARLAFLATAPDGNVFQIYRDDQVGDSIVLRDLASADYAAQTADLKGYFPISLQGSGTGAARKLSAILVRKDIPAQRTFTLTGQPVPALTSLDDFMQAVMQGGGIRAGALAVARSGKLVFAHGYTWAEADYPVTQPTSLFRLASCSKPITNIAIHHALEHNLIPTLNTHMQALLGLVTIDGKLPIDQQFSMVQIDHLLSHKGGWSKRSGRYGGAGFDPMFYDFEIAQALNKKLPISKADIATYMAGQPLQYAPGSHKVYSNFGYMLLGLILEKVSGRTYEQYIKQNIFAPLGIKRATLGRSLWENRLPDEVRYEDNTAWVSYPNAINSADWLPGPYGTFNLENLDSLGGWVCAAPDYAKLLSVFHKGVTNPILKTDQAGDVFNRAYWDDDSGDQDAVKEGLLSGSETYVVQRSDDVAVVMLFNRDNSLPDKLPMTSPKNNDLPYQFDEVAAKLPWPTDDLFPSVGLLGWG